MKIRAPRPQSTRAGQFTARALAVVLAGRVRDERGDVPGWVMVTVMTAMLVAFIGSVARDELEVLLQSALDSVTSSW